MKTIKYFTLSLILFLSGATLFASNDGTTVKETIKVGNLEITILIPQVPQVASFDEMEVEKLTVQVLDAARYLSPTIPTEAGFNDEMLVDNDLSPVVPLEAPYSETL